MSQPEPKFRGYYERFRHRAATEAMASLITVYPDWNRTAIAIEAVQCADALAKELRLTPDVQEIPNE